ncbi:hypothetical protein BDY19DRAFT_991859 [Irpex rosettiformis]|uniref:Uncharacterized protein n=1 Tax=Irpex rosettiformis TaxID=378272 RepID=A0ACB8UAE7_9APHY|nr:hypothetical protein BDY19DRAFT_991859 [Irpex rosettiformis]
MVSTRILLLSLLYGSAVFAAPTQVRKSKEVVHMNKNNNGTNSSSSNSKSNSSSSNNNNNNIAGAAYFITNEPAGNFVVAAAIHDDGSLTFDRAVSTRGVGQHGITDPNGPDPLFSQGAVKASAAAKVLAAVNPGSNTLTLFSINDKNPVDISVIGQPQSTEGEFPISVAFNKAGTQACVLNGGQVNNVNCFKVDQDKGLQPIQNTLRSIGVNQTTPATGPADSASHVIFSEDDSKLIASIKGDPKNPGFLAVWDVSSDGSLSQNFAKISAPQGGALPFGMSVIQGKNAVLATDAGIGFDVIDLSNVNSRNSNSSNSKDVSVEVKDQKAVCWAAHSGKTGNFYLTDIGTSKVTEVSVDDNLKATIVNQYQQTENSATTDDDVATINNKDFLYVLQPNATSVAVLSLDAPGKATNVGNFNLKDVADKAGLTVNANNLSGMTTFVVSQ